MDLTQVEQNLIKKYKDKDYIFQKYIIDRLSDRKIARLPETNGSHSAVYEWRINIHNIPSFPKGARKGVKLSFDHIKNIIISKTGMKYKRKL